MSFYPPFAGGVSYTSNGIDSTHNSNTIGNIYTTGGNVGIGTYTPGYALDVNGGINFSSSLYQSGTVLSSNGNLMLTNAKYTPDISNSVQRTFLAKIEESVSVKDFGAVGDGNNNVIKGSFDVDLTYLLNDNNSFLRFIFSFCLCHNNFLFIT